MPEIVTTCFQMSALSELERGRLSDPDFSVREAVERQWRLSRALYLLAGERWAWIDKQRWSDQQWESYVLSEQLRTFVASWRGSIAGYYELRRDDAQAVEIAYFGLAPHFIGLRQHLLDLLARIKEEPASEYPMGHCVDETVVCQLALFKDARARDGLERVAALNPLAGENGPFRRTRGPLVQLAEDAPEMISAGRDG